jgi:hypothetical protein
LFFVRVRFWKPKTDREDDDQAAAEKRLSSRNTDYTDSSDYHHDDEHNMPNDPRQTPIFITPPPRAAQQSWKRVFDHPITAKLVNPLPSITHLLPSRRGQPHPQSTSPDSPGKLNIPSSFTSYISQRSRGLHGMICKVLDSAGNAWQKQIQQKSQQQPHTFADRVKRAAANPWKRGA